MRIVKKLFIFALIFLVGGIKVASASYDVNHAITKCITIQKTFKSAPKSHLAVKTIQFHKVTPSLHLNHLLNAFLEFPTPQIENTFAQEIQFFD